MDVKHITSGILRSLLSITSKKEQLNKAVADIENEISKALKWPITSVADASKPAKATKAARKPAKAKRKSDITPERSIGVKLFHRLRENRPANSAWNTSRTISQS